MRRGITMLEVLVAAIIMSIGLVGALDAIARCAADSREVKDRARAMMFARSKMEEILKEPTVQIGTDQGQGVDDTTDYDWQADIEQSDNSSLVIVTVVAKNRVTKVQVSLTALRRPDVSAPTTDASGNSTSGTTGATGTAGTGSAL